ncbi:hypothetical protein [Clostridium sp. BL-8]|uniref:hypothetical protein n=1 Tax=Clostridium sp. BL-8 TaxID=349938 RepID=UPI0009CA8A12|nr:hypothetical protein [Clostridium sp. BL-8]OOM78611.1 hypothetical protein CLOBL_22780 [Clostridium sp. BL-8]
MKKSSLESKLVISEVMMLNHANVAGNIYGGLAIDDGLIFAIGTALIYIRKKLNL